MLLVRTPKTDPILGGQMLPTARGLLCDMFGPWIMVCHGRQAAIRPLYLPRPLMTRRREYIQHAEYTPSVLQEKRNVLLGACGLSSAFRFGPRGALNIAEP